MIYSFLLRIPSAKTASAMTAGGAVRFMNSCFRSDAVEAILDVLRGFLVRNDIQLSLADSFREDSVGNDGRWGGPLHEFLHLFPRLQHFRSRRDLRFVAKIRWPIAPRLVDAEEVGFGFVGKTAGE